MKQLVISLGDTVEILTGLRKGEFAKVVNKKMSIAHPKTVSSYYVICKDGKEVLYPAKDVKRTV